jgi:predicted metal-binding membrane protein
MDSTVRTTSTSRRTSARSLSEGEAMAKTLSAWVAATSCVLRQECDDQRSALSALAILVKRDPWLIGIGGAIFVGAVMATICLMNSMPMDGIPMPGGWTLSGAWMPMCGKTWSRTVASFVLTWVVMMVAMMLPSLLPMLWRYRRALGGAGGRRLGGPTVLMGVGYFIVWTAIGLALFPLGAALAAAVLHQPALARTVPIGACIAILIAAALQFSPWKARQLACCRQVPGHRSLPSDAGAAMQHGLRLGFECATCCANWMAILLVVGVMDLRAMAVVTVAITAERLAPRADRVAQALGVVAVAAAGLLSIALVAAR